MFSRFIGFIFLFVFSYLLIVFIAPDVADQYGDKSINTKIRNIKEKSLQFASGSNSATSLFQKFQDTAKPYIENTQQTVQDLNTTVVKKVAQAKEASEAVQNAYSGVIDATHKIQNLTGSGK